MAVEPQKPLRKDLARVFKDNKRLIRAFEQLFEAVPDQAINNVIERIVCETPTHLGAGVYQTSVFTKLLCVTYSGATLTLGEDYVVTDVDKFQIILTGAVFTKNVNALLIKS